MYTYKVKMFSGPDLETNVNRWLEKQRENGISIEDFKYEVHMNGCYSVCSVCILYKIDEVN